MTLVAAGARRPGVRRWISRAGVRLALLNALIVVVAFAIAGVLTQVAIERLASQAVREQVEGEMRSLADEFALRGGDHLPHTIAKRTRLWRGFAYRLEAHGVVRAGFLPPSANGWSRVKGLAGTADHARRPYLALTTTLPDGARVTVGRDLSSEIEQAAALQGVLMLCGGCGVAFCLAATGFASRREWRRVEAVAEAARAVRDGRLDRRAPAPPTGARDDLDELSLAFNAMLERIELLVSQVRQVSTDIAHDLRTPLTRVRLRLERLQAQAEGDRPLLSALAEVDEDLSEILRTFDALLQLAAIHGGGEGARDEAFDLAGLAGRIAEAYRPDIEEGGRTLSLHLEPVRVVGEPSLVAQAAANLLENAMRHTPNGARLEMRVEQASGRAVMIVNDNGPGIPEAARDAVLRPLFRLESSRSLPGCGLGLSIVAAVAERCGGEFVLADAQPGLSARLSFSARPV